MAAQVILAALRTALAWTFFHAGIIKIWDFARSQSATQDFVVAIQQYKILPWPEITVLLAIYLPWLEVFVALALFIRPLRLGASTLISGLMVVFMAALISAWSRGLRIECGCFGRDEVSTDFPTLLWRDGLILAAALLLCFLDSRAARPKDRQMFGDSGRFTLP